MQAGSRIGCVEKVARKERLFFDPRQRGSFYLTGEDLFEVACDVLSKERVPSRIGLPSKGGRCAVMQLLL